ncbi:MAG: ARC6/PARC6 family protein [Pseudanabaena sp. M109S1SP1A06QC]|nr:ARC6/PARC6 family protein [Pseudanabaena sp. M109S1SP1A06QC]
MPDYLEFQTILRGLPTVTPSQNTTSATSSSTSIETASPTANPKTSPSATVNPTPSQTNANKKNEIAPLSESEAVDLVNNLVAAKNQIFAPPFDRQLLAEFTTGEAYEKRKGSIDWLQSNNAFYSYGDFKVSRAGSFGIQDNQANVTVEIFESPTLYVNGRIDQSQSQPSRGRYVCTFLFENGRWKVSNLTKVD